MGYEKRVHLRQPLQSEGWLFDQSGNRWNPISLLDVSKGGIALIAQEKLVVDSTRLFQFQLPGSSKLMNFEGRITYCAEHTFLAGYRAGIQFTRMDVIDLAAIEWFVDQKISAPAVAPDIVGMKLSLSQ